MAHFEKTNSSKTLFEGKIITLTLDDVTLENGKTALREVVHHNGGACVAALTPKNEIYLVQQFRYPFSACLWELPAGKLEKGEDAFVAAKRELEEEVGVTAKNYFSLGEMYPTVGYCSEIIYIYGATDLTCTAVHPDEDEFLTIKKFPLQTAVDMVLNGEIKDGKTICGILKLQAYLAKNNL